MALCWLANPWRLHGTTDKGEQAKETPQRIALVAVLGIRAKHASKTGRQRHELNTNRIGFKDHGGPVCINNNTLLLLSLHEFQLFKLFFQNVCRLS